MLWCAAACMDKGWQEVRVIAGVIGFLALLGAAALGGLMLAAWLSEIPVTQEIGRLWFAVDPGSLGATQAAVERYLWPPVWDYAIFPMLQLPAATTAVVAFVAALLLLSLSRSGTSPGSGGNSRSSKRSRRLFKR